jgi:hypothetical protein
MAIDISIDKIKNNLQIILNKSHKEQEKKVMRIKNYGSRPLIEMSCPICGDSEKNLHKKRGNLYLNNLFYICFNCGEKLSYLQLLERFDMNIDFDEKMKIYNHIDSHSKKISYTDKNNSDLSELDKIMDLEEVIEKYNQRKDELFDIKPVQTNSIVYQYLKFNRKITNFNNIYEGILKITNKWFEPVIIILNRNDNNLLGFQIRNLKDDKKKRIYKIYDFQTIYNYVNEEKIDDNKSLPYNKLSHFYNILNIDFYDKITVFEGYLDSVFFPNSIGTTGVETDYTFLLENEDLDIRFFYDNDRVGLNKSIEKIDSGYSVFLWKRLFKDLAKGNSLQEYKLNKKIKDLNDVAKIIEGDVYEKLNLEKYFSIDKFDKIFL